MSNNQTTILFKSVEDLTVRELRKILSEDFKIERLSYLRKDHLVRIAKELYIERFMITETVNVYGVSARSYKPSFDKAEINKEGKKIRTTKEAFRILSSFPDSKHLIKNISSSMASGVKLSEIFKSPEEYLELASVPRIKKLAEHFNPYYIAFPTREMGLVWVSELSTAELKHVDGSRKVVIKPRLELRAQNHMIDSLASQYVWITRNDVTGDIEVISRQEAVAYQKEGRSVSRVKDMRYVVSMDYNLAPPEGQTDLSNEQKLMQFHAVVDGVYFNFNGQLLNAEYYLASASEKRTVMGTHIVGMDAVEALHALGMDFRQFAKFNGKKYVLDMIKAPTRFGLASTSSVPSQLIKMGNQIKEYSNGEYAIVGGTHTMKCVNDVYSYIHEGKYLAYDAADNSFETLDASEIPYKQNVTDGLIFADESIMFSLNAEFGKLMSAVQVRITPATKGLVVFVPGLKKMVGHDLLAFESATKGDYRTLLRTNPDFNIEFRVAIFSKDAKKDKKKVTMPYQMSQTLFTQEHFDVLKDKLDSELEEAFSVYDSPEKLSEYLGTKSLEIYEDVSQEELTEEQREHIDNTLVSMFTKFFYTGEFVMEDPYFKKRLLDIIENIIKGWAKGAIPVEGHYRFMVSDVYSVMEAYRNGHRDLQKGKNSKYIEDGDFIVPSDSGIPADRVVMVDDNDEYFIDGKEIVFQRNPKISSKETAMAKGIIIEEYYKARKKFPFAFNNLVFFSAHDFNVIKQGGADYDGDKTLASLDSTLVNAYVNQPALLDYTKVYNEATGEVKYVEGCPYQPKTIAEFNIFGKKYRSDVVIGDVTFNDEFKVEFTDEDYDMDFARKVHELSKVFVLRSLEPNQIGELTNYATKILAAISRLEWSLINNIDVNGESLDEPTSLHYKNEIEKMTEMVDLLRLLQGWEIDKPKHGGAFWNALSEQLRFITDPTHFPIYASEVETYESGSKRVVYSKLEWHASAKSKTPLEKQEGRIYRSLMQQLRNHVVGSFHTTVKERFMKLNPSLDNNNLIYTFAPHANAFDHNLVNSVTKELTPIMRDYGLAQREIMETRSRFEKQRAHMNFSSHHEARVYDRKMKQRIDLLMDKAIRNAQSRVKSLPFDEATVAFVAYVQKYRNYRPEKALSPASGLSFPWVVCRDGMFQLVSRVSGKSLDHVELEAIKPALVDIRFKSFEFSPDKVASLFTGAKQAAVWFKEDEITGNYLPFVYVGTTRVGILTEEASLYFTGSDKFVFLFDNFNLSSTGKSAGVRLRKVVRC